jgi:hypothetical protein
MRLLRLLRMQRLTKTNNSRAKTGKPKQGAFPRLSVGYEHKGNSDASFSANLDMQLALSKLSKK